MRRPGVHMLWWLHKFGKESQGQPRASDLTCRAFTPFWSLDLPEVTIAQLLRLLSCCSGSSPAICASNDLAPGKAVMAPSFPDFVASAAIEAIFDSKAITSFGSSSSERLGMKRRKFSMVLYPWQDSSFPTPRYERGTREE